jgi:hypothetical protein
MRGWRSEGLAAVLQGRSLVRRGGQTIAWVGGLVGLAVFCSAPVSAKAVVDSPANFTIPWIVVADRSPVGIVQKVKSRTSIASAMLVPETAFGLESDIVDETGSVLLGSSVPLAGSTSKFGPFVACTFRVSDKRAKAFIAFGSEKYLCLIDSAGRGVFDRAFVTKSAFAGIIAGRHKVSSKAFSIRPASYKPKDARRIAGLPRIYVQYGWTAGLVGKALFQVCFKENTTVPTDCLTGSPSVDVKSLPASFSSFGAQFTLRSKLESGVEVSMDSEFVEQPLTVLIQDSW